MADALPHVPPVVPTPHEREALAIVECYLARAGDATGTLLLSFDGTGEIALASTIRDQFANSAALCRGALEAFEDQDAWMLRLP